MRSGWEARQWSPIIVAEHRATRDRVVMFDLTPFAKLEVSGPGALDVLAVCHRQPDGPASGEGDVHLHVERGKDASSATSRSHDWNTDRFLVITGRRFSGFTTWPGFASHLPGDGSVSISDLTSSRCCIGLWGPEARKVIARRKQRTTSPATRSPIMTGRNVTIGDVPALALRISYVGELGWEALRAQTEFGLKVCGYALGGWPDRTAWWRSAAALSTRCAWRKGYRLWGSDINTDYNPYEAGIGFAVRLNKGRLSWAGRRLKSNSGSRALSASYAA